MDGRSWGVPQEHSVSPLRIGHSDKTGPCGLHCSLSPRGEGGGGGAGVQGTPTCILHTDLKMIVTLR